MIYGKLNNYPNYCFSFHERCQVLSMASWNRLAAAVIHLFVERANSWDRLLTWSKLSSFTGQTDIYSNILNGSLTSFLPCKHSVTLMTPRWLQGWKDVMTKTMLAYPFLLFSCTLHAITTPMMCTMRVVNVPVSRMWQDVYCNVIYMPVRRYSRQSNKATSGAHPRPGVV